MRQLSWQGVALEWIKAGTVFAALMGIVATLYIGQKQAKLAQLAAETQSENAEQGRAADRFDKALGRLADRDNPVARMSGVAGLRLFLVDRQSTHQREALHYLVTALGGEMSPRVQQAILDAFVDAKEFDQTAKDDALRTAVEIDRSLTDTRFNEMTTEKNNKALALLKEQMPAGTQNEIEDLISYRKYLHSKDLTFLQKMKISGVYYTRYFYDPNVEGLSPQPETDTLDKYVSLNMLLAAGAKNQNNNWSNIYCQHCDFRPAVDLSGANFDGAFLSGADFSHVKLRGSSIRNADLGEAKFFASDLTGADLSWKSFDTSLPRNAITNATQNRPSQRFLIWNALP